LTDDYDFARSFSKPHTTALSQRAAAGEMRAPRLAQVQRADSTATHLQEALDV
jgi:hypothetical protein